MARKSRKNPAAAPESPKTVTYAAWGYARISIDDERSEDSIDNQTAIIQSYANDKQDIDLRDVITDLGHTGTDFDRPGYAELLGKIECGDIQCVIVKDLSRLGRAYIEVGQLLFDTFPAYNVRFISVNDQYDSFSDDAARKKLLILFKNLINHMYSRDLGKKIRSAHDTKKQRGELAGNVPYGYKRGDDGITLVPDSDAAEIVKMVFDMRLQGKSANAIAKHLTAEGIPSPQMRRYQLGQISHQKFSGRIVWNIGMVSKMLRNETYTGTLVQGKYHCNGKQKTMLPKEQWIRHDNTHEAIICPEQFAAVQSLMDQAAAKYERGANGSLAENCYAGKIICTRCGKVVVRCSGGSRERIRFYYCCRHCDYDLKREHNLTKTPKLTLSTLDNAVLDALRKQIELMIDSEQFIENLTQSEMHSQRRAQLAHGRLKWEKAAADADKQLSASYTHHLDGLLDMREFELIRAKIERNKQEAAANLAQIESQLKRYDDMSARHHHWRQVYAEFTTAKSATKELVSLLIDRIELTPLTNEIHIFMNYQDGLSEYRAMLIESVVSESA